jgi:hypothetical protein
VSLSDQHEKCGLGCVLDICGVGQNSATGAQDQRPVPRHERCERRFIPARDKPLQKLGVVQPRSGVCAEERAELLEYGDRLLFCHGASPRNSFGPSLLLEPGSRQSYR